MADQGIPGSDEKTVAPLAGGSNQARVRDYNERLVLSLIQRENELSRAEIARRTGLSPQAVNLITRQLEKDGLLARGQPVRGRVGQPSIPMRLEPSGGFAFGLKVGRRSAEVILLDFAGKLRAQQQTAYPWPEPEAIVAFCGRAVTEITASLEDNLRERICGVGVAIPFDLWSWEQQVGAPKGAMAVWRDFDMGAEIASATGHPVTIVNDASAACAGELQYGRGREFANFGYVFVGFFVGGGVVLEHALFTGPTGNAGAVGSMPLGRPPGEDTLIDEASILMLERMIADAGLDPARLWLRLDGWEGLGEILDVWLERVAERLAVAILTMCSVIDFEAIMIDGSFPPQVRNALVTRVINHLGGPDAPLPPGLSPFRIEEGSLGQMARSIGAAGVQIRSRYLLRQSVLFKGQDATAGPVASRD